MPYLYILYSSKLNKYYVGACANIERRLYEHNIGHSKFTSTGLPWQLMYTEEFKTLQEAKQREKKILSLYPIFFIFISSHPSRLNMP